jgi:hypothetical protein
MLQVSSLNVLNRYFRSGLKVTANRTKLLTFLSCVIQRDFHLGLRQCQTIISQNVEKEKEEEYNKAKERSSLLDITKIFRDDQGNEVEDISEHLVRPFANTTNVEFISICVIESEINVQWKPLTVITLGHTATDNINRMNYI